MTLIDLLKKSSDRLPGKVAVKYVGRKLTFGELESSSSFLAAFLIDKFSLKRSNPIGILLNNSIEYIISLFGVAKTGCSFVPINTFLKPTEIGFILKDAGIEVLITSSEFFNILNDINLRELNIELILTSKVREGLEGYTFFDQILDSKIKSDLPKPSPDDIAGILYTSGTSGTPKGVMLTHKNFCSNVEQSVSCIQLNEKAKFLLLLPMFHSFTLTVCVFVPVFTGATIIMQRSIKGFHKVLKMLIVDRVSVIVGIPHLFRLLCGMKFPRILLKLLSVKLCISGASPLGNELPKRFYEKFKIPLLEGYGLTEASPVVSINPPKKPKYGSVGLPLPGIQIKIVDPSTGHEVDNQMSGELLVKGDNVMKGYFKREDDTLSTIRKSWLYTGDIVRLDSDGYLFIVDRKKDLIISHGMNVYPREIENVLLSHPGIKEVAVVGRRDYKRGEIPIAFVVSETNDKNNCEKEIIDLCRKNLAGYKIPHEIIFRDSLPKLPTGKILKRALK